MVETKMKTRAPTLFDDVLHSIPGSQTNLELCLQCGTCAGSCPSGGDMDHTPRAIFAMLKADMKDEVLLSNTPWYCVSCYYCMTRCPQDIHITDIMYSLKRMAIKEGYYKDTSTPEAPGFSETFVDQVEKYGRSYELGVAAFHHIKHHPIDAMKMAASMGRIMFLKGRLDLRPNKIKNMKQLSAILTKAKELGGDL